ncbi:hypothetical protein B0H11DRAFT_2034705 [Mycena galericulata]|nr:hypothetical protein B0H11DRAFT_2034705 [Mycena galericulata]
MCRNTVKRLEKSQIWRSTNGAPMREGEAPTGLNAVDEYTGGRRVFERGYYLINFQRLFRSFHHIPLYSLLSTSFCFLMSYMPAAPTATAAAFVAVQENLWAAESEASYASSRLRSSPGDVEPAHADAAAIVQGILSHHLFSVGPTVLAALEDTLLRPSFRGLAQELEDAAAPNNIILAFRRQWRRYHQMPEVPHERAMFRAALEEHTFGAAAALFVDELHVSDRNLDMLISMWREEHGEDVLQPGDSSMFLTFEAMRRLALY